MASRRPFELELLRWSHDGRSGDAEADDSDDASESKTFEQLECMTGTYRHGLNGGHGGGVRWEVARLSGAFLRCQPDGPILWLPEAGVNFLVQAGPGQDWELVELGRHVRSKVAVDQLRGTYGEFAKVPHEATVSMLASLRARARRSEAWPHLADDWIQAAEDLRLRSWDWSPVRQGARGSDFEFATSNFGYVKGAPLADPKHGYFGELRWQWEWREDGRGGMTVRNRAWSEKLSLKLCPTSLVLIGPEDGSQITWLHKAA